jgi:hypothetical protein
MKIRHSLFAVIFLTINTLDVQAQPAGITSYETTVYADIVGNELLWSREKSSSSDIAAMYSKKTGEWYFQGDKNKIDVKKLGTPWMTDGSTVGILSGKSSVLNGYVASCIADAVSSSGMAGNLLTSYLILKSPEKGQVFQFSAEDGCDAVELSNPKNVRFSYQKLDMQKPGRLIVNSVTASYRNDEPVLVQTGTQVKTNSLVRQHFDVVKSSLVQ